jgi:hypothetical protein
MRVLVGLALTTLLAAAAAQAGPYRAPRTSFGAPDLQGIWTNTSATMLQRPPPLKTLNVTEAEAAAYEAMFRKFLGGLASDAPIDPKAPAPKATDEVDNADWLEMNLKLARVNGQIRSSWIVDPPDGRLPFTEAGRAASKASAKREDTAFDGPEVRPTAERCLTAIGSPEGPPMLNTGFNAHYQIVQTRDAVTILVEMNHDVRIVRLGDRRHPPQSVTRWMGDSVGWWDGDTLVVETANLNPKAEVWTLGGGYFYSPMAKVVERFTRTAPDQLLYEFTIDDPATFTRPWRGEMPMRAAKGPIYEYACHEGNYSLPNILAGARAQERAEARAAPAHP